MTTYTYTGKQPHRSTIRVGAEGKKTTQDLILVKDQDVSLDETHNHIKMLVRRGLLVEKKQQSTSSPKSN